MTWKDVVAAQGVEQGLEEELEGELEVPSGWSIVPVQFVDWMCDYP